MDDTSIYIIKLNGNKLYVGKTKNYTNRMDTHLVGNGAKWVQKHGFIESSKKGTYSSDIASWEETKLTLSLMLEYGINNVRGAEYCQLADFKIEDCKRISFCIIHHLSGHDDPLVIENKLRSKYTSNDDQKDVFTQKKDVFTQKKDVFTQNKKEDLLQILKNLRNKIVRSENVQFYNVFRNDTLEEMSIKKPLTIDDLLKIKGVGPFNSSKYGELFLNEIRNY